MLPERKSGLLVTQSTRVPPASATPRLTGPSAPGSSCATNGTCCVEDDGEAVSSDERQERRGEEGRTLPSFVASCSPPVETSGDKLQGRSQKVE